MVDTRVGTDLNRSGGREGGVGMVEKVSHGESGVLKLEISEASELRRLLLRRGHYCGCKKRKKEKHGN